MQFKDWTKQPRGTAVQIRGFAPAGTHLGAATDHGPEAVAAAGLGTSGLNLDIVELAVRHLLPGLDRPAVGHPVLAGRAPAARQDAGHAA